MELLGQFSCLSKSISRQMLNSLLAHHYRPALFSPAAVTYLVIAQLELSWPTVFDAVAVYI